MDASSLEELGFTNAEIKIYLALLELGVSTAGPLIKKTHLQNSVVHLTLTRLVEKGIISFVKKAKVKNYQSNDPKNLLKILDEKRVKIENLIPQLSSIQQNKNYQEAEIFEGYRGLLNMHYEFIKEAKKGEEYLFFAFHTSNPDNAEQVYNFYRDFEKERKKIGLDVKGISPEDIKEKFKGRDTKKVLFVDFPIVANISVFRDKVMFTMWEDDKLSILVTSKQLAESFRKYFYSVWRKYRKD
jgi:sugar-specific transcriptional regulator TrmB|tara:strand:+ start:329 stop:1054 length:726 start_codon:yes stop_codon:yes gene_type:complete